MSYSDPVAIYGVDFSGADHAGDRIWITEARLQGGVLRIENCFRAKELPGSGKGKEKCLAALKEFIADRPGAFFGLDFPFGLPKEVVDQERWEEFVLAFPELYADPNHLRNSCLKRASNKELRRLTDILNKAPFSPYNLRIYKQTYFGIKEILHPLFRGRLCSIIPFQSPGRGQPRVMEICPASTLKAEGLYRKYKNISQHSDRHHARLEVLKGLEARWPLKIRKKGVRDLILGDRNGDALDSVLAALAVFRNLKVGARVHNGESRYMIEGCIYA